MLLSANHHDRVASAAMLALGLLCVGTAGLLLLRVVGRRSNARRLHGQYVFRWSTVGWIAGSGFGVYLVAFPSYHVGEADVGCAGFGLLAGWVIGMIHGAIALWLRKRRAT